MIHGLHVHTFFLKKVIEAKKYHSEVQVIFEGYFCLSISFSASWGFFWELKYLGVAITHKITPQENNLLWIKVQERISGQKIFFPFWVCMLSSHPHACMQTSLQAPQQDRSTGKNQKPRKNHYNALWIPDNGTTISEYLRRYFRGKRLEFSIFFLSKVKMHATHAVVSGWVYLLEKM